jgi:hypothetical protein
MHEWVVIDSSHLSADSFDRIISNCFRAHCSLMVAARNPRRAFAWLPAEQSPLLPHFNQLLSPPPPPPPRPRHIKSHGKEPLVLKTISNINIGAPGGPTVYQQPSREEAKRRRILSHANGHRCYNSCSHICRGSFLCMIEQANFPVAHSYPETSTFVKVCFSTCFLRRGMQTTT